MQKTGWTNYSSFLSTLDVITREQSTIIFLCIRPFSAWCHPNNRVIWEQACLWPVRRQFFAKLSWDNDGPALHYSNLQAHRFVICSGAVRIGGVWGEIRQVWYGKVWWGRSGRYGRLQLWERKWHEALKQTNTYQRQTPQNIAHKSIGPHTSKGRCKYL